MRTANSNEGLAGDVTRSLHCQCFLMLVSKMVCYAEQLAASNFLMIVLRRFARTALGSGLMGRSGQKVGAALGVAQVGGGKTKIIFKKHFELKSGVREGVN